ncbi:amino acid deaminase [Microbulbifer halophilus]|uniref:Amino acid deaminase n=1 Tax=Microbulbifer halophilus TaxID=453963 RepID=A0ABW5EAL9_9GAMM|nr:amino acid deaminase [Microbulbifer halophilus]MCW8125732.1 amino acid deaminase [Microbulbifer halophilus]
MATPQDSPGPSTPLNLLREELLLPVAVVYRSHFLNNLHWMQSFADRYGVALAPHGKTTMTPAFFREQIAAGAWGITLATAPQAAAAARAGIRRLLMANQLVGRQNMELISDLLAEAGNESVDFYCLVDSTDNVRQLGEFFSARGQQLQVLIEIGVPGGRCGCRSREAVEAVCAAVAAQPALALAGVETYEGLIHGEHAEARVREHLISVRDLCIDLLREECFDTERAILTGAGSAWYDLVAEVFTECDEPRLLPVIRPGCYLIHDCGIYREAQRQVMERLHSKPMPDGDLQSSLEVWAYVQSLPEAGLAILGLGKRDAAFDAGLPQASLYYRPGSPAPRPAPHNWRTTAIMDQHCTMEIPADADLGVGDMIALSTSHPCLTFDKWRQIHMIDDEYNLLRRVETEF